MYEIVKESVVPLQRHTVLFNVELSIKARRVILLDTVPYIMIIYSYNYYLIWHQLKVVSYNTC